MKHLRYPLLIALLVAASGCSTVATRSNPPAQVITADSAGVGAQFNNTHRMTLTSAPWQAVNIGTGPNSGNGDPLRTAFVKINANEALLEAMFGTSSNLYTNGSVIASDIIGLFSGCSGTEYLGADGACHSGGGGSMVYPGAGIANSTGTAWGTSYTTSGSGTVICLTVSCVMTTPNIGAATATSINGNTFTTGTYTVTGSAGKTFDFTNSITISGTDSTTMTMPGTSQTLAGLGAAETWTAAQKYTNSDFLLLGSSTGATTFTSANASATNYTLTLPAITDTVATLTATQTLTNKSIAGSEVNSGTLPTAQLPALTGDATASAGSGATTVVKVNGGALPVSAAALATNSSGQIISGSAGTVTDGSGTTTANQLMVSSTTAHAYTVATPSSCLAVTSSTIAINAAINAQTGTSYTVLSTDACKLVTLNNASAIAVTLPQATGSFAAGFSFDAQNLGAGLVTITPTTSTINGASTLTIPHNTGCTVTSDGTNYQVSACTAIAGTTVTVASGTAALGTSAIASAACATAVTVSATGVATTDTITAGFNGDPTAVTGYAPVTTGMLTIVAYPTANNANFKVCNLTSASITPGAITLNWRVVR